MLEELKVPELVDAVTDHGSHSIGNLKFSEKCIEYVLGKQVENVPSKFIRITFGAIQE